MSTRNTLLRYENLEDIIIKEDENISDSRLNESFTKLIENDKSLSPLNNNIPGLWECRWLNDDTIEGYKKGYSVWYNTEDIDEFIKVKSSELYLYGLNNKYLVRKIKPYDESNKEINDFYHEMLTGFYRPEYGMTEPLPPVFDIGTLTGNVQVYISLIDNNKIPPSLDKDGKYWKTFLKESSTTLINEILSTLGGELYSNHIKDYHFGFNKDTRLSDTFLDQYLTKDLKNVSKKLKFQDHVLRNNLNGFDYVLKEVQITDTETIEIYQKKNYKIYQYELSTIKYNLIDTENYSNDVTELKLWLSNTINYTSDVHPFLSKITTDDIGFANIYYMLSSNFMYGSSQPKKINWKDRKKYSDILNRYSTSYSICKKNVTTLSDTENSSDYKLWKDEYILSTIDETSIPSHITDYKYPPTVISTEIRTELCGTTSLNIPNKWFRLWNSGYLEHGGSITIKDADKGKLKTVDLEWGYDGLTSPIYDYPSEGNESFYLLYDKFSDTTSDTYDKEKNLQDKYRYIVTLTPNLTDYNIDNGDYNVYINLEITEIKNDSFKIKIPSNSKVKSYTYYVSGFRGV